MTTLSNCSAQEIICLAKSGYESNAIITGNQVQSLGFFNTLHSSLTGMLGRELKNMTQLLENGRRTALQRMLQNMNSPVIRVQNQLFFHDGCMEFIASGNRLTHKDKHHFSAQANGQELYIQLDAGYNPVSFVFGNAAYSTGISGGLIGSFKNLAQGEVKELSEIFKATRYSVLDRIIQQAKNKDANALIGIKISISKFSGVSEMLMKGTAAYNSQFSTSIPFVSSHLNDHEVWSLAKCGFAPQQLLMSSAIYSLGFAGKTLAKIKSIFNDEMPDVSILLNSARQNAFADISTQAKEINADQVIGLDTQILYLGNGLIEFFTLGTAIRKSSEIHVTSPELIPEALTQPVKQNVFVFHY